MLARLHETSPPSIELQYAKWRQLSVLPTLVGSRKKKARKSINDVTKRNTSTMISTEKPQLLLASGPAGCGKTRMGYETLSQVGRVIAGRARAAGSEAWTHFFPVFVHLGNGCGPPH